MEKTCKGSMRLGTGCGTCSKCKKEILQMQIAESKAKLEQLEQLEKKSDKDFAIRKLEDISTEEKLAFFDGMFNSAVSELEELEVRGYTNEDNAQYAWEEYIVILAKDRKLFWNYWNSLYN